MQEPLDHALEAAPLENQCVAALARRYCAALPQTAALDPAQAHQLYRGWPQKRPAAWMNRLWIAAMWISWRQFCRSSGRGGRTTAMCCNARAQPDALVVEKLLDMLGQAADPTLRQALTGFFCERLGAAPDSLTEVQLVEAVRASVEAATQETNRQRLGSTGWPGGTDAPRCR